MIRLSRFALLVACCVAYLSVPTARGQDSTTVPSPARLAAAHRVLDASGSIETMIAAMRANLPAQRLVNPQIPAEFWSRVEAKLVEAAPELMDSIAVLYARRFTQEELEAMVAFYQSPVGRHLRELQPGLVTESAALGQRWGMRIGAEIGASLLKEPPQE
ncbi:MAG TPA: DUF2059 domain-containing protein [Gemmatimonadales bacterium]|nr:DUF2059 domain-containing protein [Gemmatimonadales bacterium]